MQKAESGIRNGLFSAFVKQLILPAAAATGRIVLFCCSSLFMPDDSYGSVPLGAVLLLTIFLLHTNAIALPGKNCYN